MIALFWLTIGAMTIMMAVLLAWPLFDSRDREREVSFALIVYRDQLAEIARDAARGTLDQDQALAMRIEIERRVLAHDTAERSRPRHARTSMTIPAAAIIVLPLVAFILYLRLGSPGLVAGSASVAERVFTSPASRATDSEIFRLSIPDEQRRGQ